MATELNSQMKTTETCNIESQKSLKRPLESTNENISSNEQSFNIRDLGATDAWPRFLVMESTSQENSLSRLSPFVIEKAMKGICDAVNVKKLRSGSLLIEVSRPAQATNLLKQTSFASVPVKVSPHRTMNSCKGVIRDRDLADMDREELINELKTVGVTDARNITQTRNGMKIKTAAVVLTFARAILPKSISAGYTKIKVEPFIPNPLRCYTCQRFGHHQSTCKGNKICARCGQPDHGTDSCTAAPHCANCNGDHPAYATSCPKWEREKEICRVKVLQNVTFPEARRMLNPVVSESNNRITYSAMAHPTVSTVSVGTQTDVTGCKCKANITQNEQRNNNKTEQKQVKDASDQTVDSEQDKISGDNGAASQQNDMPWNKVGGRRTHSLSPQSKPENRSRNQRGNSGESPPDKQFRSSKSPAGSGGGTKNRKEDKSLGAMASGGHASSQAPRPKINLISLK